MGRRFTKSRAGDTMNREPSKTIRAAVVAVARFGRPAKTHGSRRAGSLASPVRNGVRIACPGKARPELISLARRFSVMAQAYGFATGPSIEYPP